MGKIKTMLIKRAGNQVLSKYSNKLTDNFEKNKKEIANFMTIPNKKLRNIVAGYLTKKMKQSKAK